MKTIFVYLAFSVFLILTACQAKEKSFIAKFEGDTSEQKWAIKDLNPDLPSDWSQAGYMTFDYYATSTQRFYVNLYDAGGIRTLRVLPFQNA
jgi:hypothetical protein